MERKEREVRWKDGQDGPATMAAMISCDQQMAAQRRPLQALTNPVWPMTGLGLASGLWREL